MWALFFISQLCVVVEKSYLCEILDNYTCIYNENKFIICICRFHGYGGSILQQQGR